MKKIIGGCGIVLCVLLLVLGAYHLGRVRGGEQTTQTEPQSQTKTLRDETDSADNNGGALVEETKAETVSANTDNEVEVKYTVSSAWENGGKTYTNIEAAIVNHSKTDVNNWVLTLTVPKKAELDQYWNSECKIADAALKAVPLDYNNVIAAGGEVSFGFIIITPSSFQPKKTTLSVENMTSPGSGDQNGNVYYYGGEDQDDGNAKDGQEQKEDGKTDTDAKENAGGNEKEPSSKKTAVKRYGKLHVDGTRLVDASGSAVQLKGVSTHGIAWFPEYVNKKAFKTLRDKMGVSLIRLAMYSDKDAGYSRSLYKKVNQGVRYATELGMYVIIDWHILSDGNPKTNQKEAGYFFKKMAKKYKNYNNVIYEICNEPNGNVTWSGDIKPYAVKMIKKIRKFDKDAVIIVGTPTWSQDVDEAAKNPIKGKNIMYTLHFYAATHKQSLRDKAQAAIDAGLPLFVTEFSICEASGNGTVDTKEGNRWIKFLDKNKISYAIWNLSNKDEASSILKASCTKTSGWKTSDYSKTGKWYLKK